MAKGVAYNTIMARNYKRPRSVIRCYIAATTYFQITIISIFKTTPTVDLRDFLCTQMPSTESSNNFQQDLQETLFRPTSLYHIYMIIENKVVPKGARNSSQSDNGAVIRGAENRWF